MKKNILFAVPLSVLVIACAQQGPGQMTDCQPVNVPDVCTSTNQVVTINVASGLTVAPPNVCAKKNTKVEFRITPINTKIIVATVPKKPPNAWMGGINIPDPNGFTITAPDKTDKYGYLIVTGSGYCLDPRITVGN